MNTLDKLTELSLKVDDSKLAKVTRTTNENGEIKVQLPVGKYKLTETEAPEHYLVNSESTEYYIDINKENKCGETPLYIACDNGYENIVKYFQEQHNYYEIFHL